MSWSRAVIVMLPSLVYETVPTRFFTRQTTYYRGRPVKRISKVSDYVKSGFAGKGYEKTLYVTINPDDNGGEAVSLEVDLFRDEEGVGSTNTHLTTFCYGTSSAKISLWGVQFRQLAEAVKLLSEALPALNSSEGANDGKVESQKIPSNERRPGDGCQDGCCGGMH